jgi:hypothetical protein
MCYRGNPSFLSVVYSNGPPLWSSGQSSWLQFQRSEFESPTHYQTFWEVMGLERGPLSLVTTIEELFRRNNSCSGLENWQYGRKGQHDTPLSAEVGTIFPDKRRSLGIVRSRTQTTESVFFWCILMLNPTVKLVCSTFAWNLIAAWFKVPWLGRRDVLRELLCSCTWHRVVR